MLGTVINFEPLPIRIPASPDELLTHDEEIALAKIITAWHEAEECLETGQGSAADKAVWQTACARGRAARDELVLRNQGLVGKVARRYFDTGLTFEDLMQEGQIGLIKAANRYDAQRGTRFSTYAVWWIRQAIGRAVANTGRMVRLPVNLGQKVMQVRRTEVQLQQEFGREATTDEIAIKLKWTPEQVTNVQGAVVNVTSLEKLVGPGDSADTELQELLPDETVQQPEDEAEDYLMSSEIQKAIDSLGEWEAGILRMRFGFEDGEMHPLSDLARRYGLSREGMRQVANRALDKIRRSEYSTGLQEYVR